MQIDSIQQPSIGDELVKRRVKIKSCEIVEHVSVEKLTEKIFVIPVYLPSFKNL
jgi:hypothetical protein